MTGSNSENWRDLCTAALDAKDPDELLRIVQRLNKALKREEQVRRDFRTTKSGKEGMTNVASTH